MEAGLKDLDSIQLVASGSSSSPNESRKSTTALPLPTVPAAARQQGGVITGISNLIPAQVLNLNNGSASNQAVHVLPTIQVPPMADSSMVIANSMQLPALPMMSSPLSDASMAVPAPMRVPIQSSSPVTPQQQHQGLHPVTLSAMSSMSAGHLSRGSAQHTPASPITPVPPRAEPATPSPLAPSSRDRGDPSRVFIKIESSPEESAETKAKNKQHHHAQNGQYQQKMVHNALPIISNSTHFNISNGIHTPKWNLNPQPSSSTGSV